MTGVLETSRNYYRWYGGKNNALSCEAGRRSRLGQDLADHSLVQAVSSKREITIDAVDAFFRRIVENKSNHTVQAAVDSTLAALLGRAAFGTGREVTWNQLLNSDD